MNERVRTAIRSRGLVLYWAGFAAWTLWAARDPGFVALPRLIPYPWLDVFVTWGMLAVETVILGAILRPSTFRRSWGRLAFALLLELCLLVWRAFMLRTDMPGTYYVPPLFTLVTCFARLASMATWSVGVGWQRVRQLRALANRSGGRTRR